MEAMQSKIARLEDNNFVEVVSGGTSSGLIQDYLSSLRPVGLGVHERRVRRRKRRRARRGRRERMGNNPINVPWNGLEVEDVTETDLLWSMYSNIDII